MQAWVDREQLEEKLEQDCMAWLGKIGLGRHHLKLNVLGRRDWPDRLIVLPRSGILFVEFKRKDEEPTRGQWRMIKLLRACGADVCIIRDLEVFKELIRACL